MSAFALSGMGAQSAESGGSSGGPPKDGVTFVIPTKDRATLLAETLRSVKEQTHRAAAVIVCDDGSTEDVESVAGRAGAIHLRNERGDWGAAGARNAGLAKVETPLVWFLDSDDLLLPDAVERLHRALTDARQGAPFAYGQALHGARDGGRWRPAGLMATYPDERRDSLTSIYVRDSVPLSCALVRTAEARGVGGFDPSTWFSQDHLFWIRLAQRGTPVYVAEPIGVHRLHSPNLYTPLGALHDNLRIAAIGETDRRLAAHRPRRHGVLLVESLSDAVHRRRVDRAVEVLWRLLIRQRKRLTIVRSAIWRARQRRHAYRQSIALWDDRADIRAWLASFR
jgi:glycosyltransferase involved in cell wall biosynthesis